MDVLMVQGARVLTPAEYRALRGALNLQYKILLDGLLFTGVRDVEFRELLEHPEWLNSKRMYIHLPAKAVRKEKVKFKERKILLSSYGLPAVERLFDQPLTLPTREAMRHTLKRAARRSGIGEEGIVPKMMRKTWESWLVASYPEMTLQIAMSQGHDQVTAMHHYLNIGFSAQEVEDMKPYVMGWRR